MTSRSTSSACSGPEKIRPPAEAVRASLEVADIFRAAGPTYRATHAGHLSLHQLKVMSAIENCRTAAMGGHVEACEDCGHQRIAYNSCRNRHCPKCQGAAARTWLAEREADLLPVGYFHVVFTHSRRGRRHRLPQQGGHLRPAVPGGLGDDAHHRRRPTPSRRAHRHHRRAPHLGIGDDAPSAHPHDRARRRHLARRESAGCRPGRPFCCRCVCCRRLFRRLFLTRLLELQTPAGSPSSATTPGCASNAPSAPLARLQEEATAE